MVALFLLSRVLTFGLPPATSPHATTPTVEIAPGVMYPIVQLGTCCGSDPNVGLADWVNIQKAGGLVAIDTAWGYKDQPAIATGLRKLGMDPSDAAARKKLWFTTKIPPGTFCTAKDPTASVLDLVQQNLQQLNTSYVDLTLVHAPCDRTGKPSPADVLAWKGMMEAVKRGWTRTIGVDDYKPAQVDALVKALGPSAKPAVNMCRMSMKQHDDATITYCIKNGITYNAFEVMRDCLFDDPLVKSLATKYQASAAQICAVWTRQRGCTMSLGTGANATTVAQYTREDLDIFGFNMTKEEVDKLSALGNKPDQ